MIRQFSHDTALLLVDCQKGVNVLEYWGGPAGRRCNPDAEDNIRALLDAFRNGGVPVLFTQHDSREAGSPLKISEPGGEFIDGIEPGPAEQVFVKDVNSGFIGTGLELTLRRNRIHRLVTVGFFTNMCVETTVRMSNNLGFDTYLVDDACACSNRVGPDGTDYDAELVQSIAVAGMHREFCTALKTADALELLQHDVDRLDRVQGNE